MSTTARRLGLDLGADGRPLTAAQVSANFDLIDLLLATVLTLSETEDAVPEPEVRRRAIAALQAALERETQDREEADRRVLTQARDAAANALAQALDAAPSAGMTGQELDDETRAREAADAGKVDKIGDDDIVITDWAKGIVFTTQDGHMFRLTILNDGHLNTSQVS